MKPLRTKYARRRIQVERDENGVPHIHSDSWRTCLYGLGYMHAIDRPTQILFAREIARGTASGKISNTEELAETDRFFRKAGLYRSLEEEARTLDDRTFSDLTSYCEGINDGMKDAGRSLPMWATGFEPEPWTQKSVLLIGNLLSYGGLAIGQQQSERLLLELIQLVQDDQRLRELFAPRLDHVDFDLLRQVKVSHQLSDHALELIADLPRLAGSNAWAVAPHRSASGAALLASDPHLEVNRLPAIWYETVLAWEDKYVMGASLPGCPLFGVGRNDRVSWGVTYVKGDTSDYFIEDCRRGEAEQWQYRRGSEWFDYEVRDELIERKDSDPETLHVYSNEVGTLEGDPDQLGPGLCLSLQWAGHYEGSGRSIATWLDVAHSTSVLDACEVVKENPLPSLNWVFADCEGHIGTQASGWFPDRAPKYNGLTPIPAWDTKNHWRGVQPSSVLPHIYDPPEGFVATANENINPVGGPQLVTLPIPDYRKRRIDERLEVLDQATLEDMYELQYDVVSVHAHDLLKIFLPHMPDGEVKDRLSRWHGNYSPESHEASLFHKLYLNVLLEIFGQHHETHGGIGWHRVVYLCSRMGFSTMVITAIDRLLHQETSSWWRERDKGEMIRRAAEQLEDKEDEPWSAVNAFRFTNRFFSTQSAGRLLGFHTGELPMPGNFATPFQGHLLRTATRESTFAPSYHFVTDMSRDEAWTNLPGGPSESRFSKYYKNDIERWRKGEYKRLAVTREEEQSSEDSFAESAE